MKQISSLSIILIVCIAFVTIIPNASAAITVSVSQSGADSDEVMKDGTFIIEASGWSGSCAQATISLSGCPSCSLSGEDTIKSIGGEATSISWTTVSASQTASAQTISVSASSGCTLQQASSSSFDIVLPPALSLTASSSVSSIAEDATFVANLNIVNNGETTANDVSIAVSGTGMSASCASISSIPEGQSAAESCTVTASSVGPRTVTFTASSTNADSHSDSFAMTVTGGGGGDDDDTGGGSPGGSGSVPSEDISQIVTIGAIEAGATGIAEFTTAQLSLTEVSITAKDAVSNVVINSLQTAAMPEAVSAPTGTIYGYLTISALNIQEENISAATITFKVNKTWLVSNNMSQDDIVLERFSNNAWTELSTVVSSSDSDYVYYTSITPGFSVFVIKARAATEPPEDGDGESPETTCTAGEKRCSGNELQQCSADGMAWNAIDTCQFGCNSESLECQPEQAPGPGSTDQTELPWLWIIIILVIIILLVLFFIIRRKKN